MRGAGRLVGAKPTPVPPAIGHELRSHRLLNESKCLPIKPPLLLAVCDVVSAPEKNTGNMAEGHWVSAGMSMTKHWLHPYPNGDALLERFWVTR